MEQIILYPDKDLELETQGKYCANTTPHITDEIYVFNFYSLVYTYPFLPFLDLTFAFNELKKIVKR